MGKHRDVGSPDVRQLLAVDLNSFVHGTTAPHRVRRPGLVGAPAAHGTRDLQHRLGDVRGRHHVGWLAATRRRRATTTGHRAERRDAGALIARTAPLAWKVMGVVTTALSLEHHWNERMALALEPGTGAGASRWHRRGQSIRAHRHPLNRRRSLTDGHRVSDGRETLGHRSPARRTVVCANADEDRVDR
jgi:hypothetical protein